MNSKQKFKKLFTVLMTLFLCFSSFASVSAQNKSGSDNRDYLKKNVLALLHPEQENAFMSYTPFAASDGSAVFCTDEAYWKDVLGDRTSGVLGILDNSSGDALDPSIYNFLQSAISYSQVPSGNYNGADEYYNGKLARNSLLPSVSSALGYSLDLQDLQVATNYALHILAGHITFDKLTSDTNLFVTELQNPSTTYSGITPVDLSGQDIVRKANAMLSLVKTLCDAYNSNAANMKVASWTNASDFIYPSVTDKLNIALKLPTEFEGNSFDVNPSGFIKVYQGSTTMINASPSIFINNIPELIKNLFPANSGITNVAINNSDIQQFVAWQDGDPSNSMEIKVDKITFTVDRDRYTSWLLSSPSVTAPEQPASGGFYFDPVAINRAPQTSTTGIDYQDMANTELVQFKGVYFEVQVPDFENETVITKTTADEAKTPVEGVKIALYDSNNQPVLVNAKGETLNLTSDANGKITLKNLPLGQYTYREVSVPAGYSIRNDSYRFEVTSTGPKTDPTNRLSTLEFTNELTRVVLTKTDLESGEPLPGVKFEVYNAAGSKVKEGTTGPDGQIVFEGLTAGETYTLKEAVIPAGYIKMADKTFTVKAKDTEQSQNVVSATNEKTEVHIKKADFADASPVANAQITIKNSSNVTVFTGISNADGDFGLEKGQLPIGSYTFTETVAPDGYKLNETVFSFEIKEDGSIVSEAKTGDKEITITDEKLDITLMKVDSKDNAGIDGVVVEVFDNAAPSVKLQLTSADGGKLHFTPGDPFLKVGHTYTVKEVTPAPGYKTSNVEYTFTIAKDGSISGTAQEIPNEPTHVELSKTEVSTAAPVPGAKLTVYNAADDSVAETIKGVKLEDLVTSADGKVAFDYLPAGNYYFLEKDAPEGFVLNPEKHEFTLNGDGTVSGRSTMSDELNKVEFVKVDGDTNDLLVGVEFKLVDSNDNDVNTNVLGQRLNTITDAEGKIILRGLKDGTYRLVEVEPIDGYFLDQNPIEFVVEKENGSHDKIIQVSPRITNAKTKVELKKLDVDKEAGVPGVTIELYEVVEHDAEGKPVKGNKVTKNALGDALNLVSDENGLFKFEGLKIGEYLYKEVSVPHGYTINQNEFVFEILKNGDVTGNKEFENSKTHVVIKKTDLADSSPVAGAEIEIFDSKGASVAKYISGEDGILPIPDGTLAIGKYTFKETIAPRGYKLNETTFEFEILEDGTILGATEIKDEKTKVILTKYDEMQELPVAGALLEVYDSEGNLVTDFAESYFTDADGVVTIIGIPVGEYTWKEAIAPQGYILNKETLSFKIAPNGEVSGTLRMINQPNEIIITKINATKTPANAKESERVIVPGATYQFWKDGKEFGEFVTDTKGQIKLLAAKPGVYTYREIKSPVGFELNTETYTFTVEADGRAHGVFVVSDRESGLYLHKKSFTTGKNLPGATFVVKDSSGKEVASGTSDANGLVLIQTLAPGKYTIEETKSPSGYVITEQKYGFTINELGSVVEGDFTVYNKLEQKEAPKEKQPVNTGFGGSTLLIGTLGGSALVAAGYLALKSKKKDEE